jgi:hypothetical protein
MGYGVGPWPPGVCVCVAALRAKPLASRLHKLPQTRRPPRQAALGQGRMSSMGHKSAVRMHQLRRTGVRGFSFCACTVARVRRIRYNSLRLRTSPSREHSVFSAEVQPRNARVVSSTGVEVHAKKPSRSNSVIAFRLWTRNYNVENSCFDADSNHSAVVFKTGVDRGMNTTNRQQRWASGSHVQRVPGRSVLQPTLREKKRNV